jgi:hypothetical protein
MMVGEAGPEYVDVTPADQMGAAGGATTIIINDRLAARMYLAEQRNRQMQALAASM